MRRAYSLRRRLIGWLFLATAILGLLALGDTWREAKRTAQDVSDRVLVGSALAIAERVTLDQSGALDVDLPYSSLEMLTSSAQDRVFYRVDEAEAGFLTGYDALPTAPIDPDGRGLATEDFSGTPVRIATIAREVSTGSGSIHFTVTVAETTLSRDALARSILFRSALRLLGMIVGAAVIVWISVTLALRPLDRVGAAISERSTDDLRPVEADAPAEVRGLVDAVNSFIGRLDGALDALRNFTGTAAHQIRTPLAVARTQIALAQGEALPGGGRAALGKAESALGRAERVLAQLLALARVDAAAGALALGPVDVAALTRDAVAEAIPAATARKVDLGYEGPTSAVARAEPVLIAELLKNLLDNALAYAGEGARVTVRVSAGKDLRLEVEDDGPGLSDGQLHALEARLKSRRPREIAMPDRGAGGHGLGLSIVCEIARLIGAEATFGPGPDGRGLVAAIRLRRD